MTRVKNKTILVTGGAKGIGKACCQRLAEEGARIAVTDIDDQAGQTLTDDLQQQGHDAQYFHLDTSDENQVIDIFDQVKNKLGPIDVLVNNAGVAGPNKPTDEVTYDEWQKLMDINVTGVFLCTKYIIPQMREQGSGSIINLSSIYGIIGAADLPPYHASKGAVRLMTKNDALFYAKENIRVNSIHPGYIWTPLVEALGEQYEHGKQAFKKLLDDAHPIGHVGEPDDIAYGVVYLASDEAKFVTGSELVIDGGYTAK